MYFLLRYKSVNFRLSFIAFLATAAILTLYFNVFIPSDKSKLIQEAEVKRHELLDARIEPILEQVNQFSDHLELLSQSVYELTDLSTTEIKLLISEIGNQQFNVKYLSKADPIAFNRDVKEYRQRPKREKIDITYWSLVSFNEKLDAFTIRYAQPIFFNKSIVGFLSGTLKLEGFNTLTKPPVGTINLFIHKENGQLLYHPDFGVSLIRERGDLGESILSSSPIREPLSNFINSNKSNSRQSSFMDLGNKYFATTVYIPKLNWYVVAYQKESDIYLPLEQNRVEYILFSLLVLGLTFSSTFLISTWLINTPIRKLTDVINKPDAISEFRKLTKVDNEFADLSEKIYWKLTDYNKQTVSDLNHIRELERQLLESRGLAQAFSQSDNAIVTLDLDFCIINQDIKTSKLLNFKSDSYQGRRYFDFVHPHMAFMKEQIKNELRRRMRWRGELILKAPDSEDEIWVNCSITPIREGAGTVISYVVALQDISSIKDSQSKIERLVYTDDLTNLSNRTFFVAQLEKLVEISKRGRYDFALIYFGVDDFKKVNDLYGHEIGDQLLKELALRLKSELRNEDTLARVSGDEFAMLMGGIKSEQDVIVKANNILSAANTPFKIREYVIKTGASLGLTMSTTDTQDPELLLQHADLAMSEAKSKGKNTYHFFTKALNDATRIRNQMESELTNAIDKEELALVFQPKVNSQSFELVGFEALVRWQNETLGFVSPADFIPLAEQSNLILKIGSWVIEQTGMFVNQLEKKVPISINLSAKQFESGTVANELKSIIATYDIEPELLELEITESSLMIDVEDAVRQLHNIKALGVGISIDDFGTGYSSLSYIKRFPVDTLKIDRSFIKDIPDDESDMEITAAIIAMSQKLGLKVIAEGAETQEQVNYLASNGCFLIQGYFYSKPLPAAEALNWQPVKG
ncbi:EAL domain-containing protein [Psychrosphaera sp.]|nr:EAL domain-containing protein [Psychrosphaera sp.]